MHERNMYQQKHATNIKSLRWMNRTEIINEKKIAIFLQNEASPRSKLKHDKEETNEKKLLTNTKNILCIHFNLVVCVAFVSLYL